MFFQHKVMQQSEDTIDYEIVIAYEFNQYSLKRSLKELGAKGETEVT